MAVTEEGISMSEENKTRPVCRIIRAMGLFCFEAAMVVIRPR